MTGDVPMVRLVLHHPDTLRLLARALDNALHFHAVQVTAATGLAEREATSGRAGEARRNERRAAEFARRRDLLQRLVDQLPTDTAPLSAPMGT